MGKKNKKAKRTVQQPKKTADTVKAIYARETAEPARGEKYVVRRKRDIENEKRELAAAKKAAEESARKSEETQAVRAGEADNSIFFVSADDKADVNRDSAGKGGKKPKEKKERPAREKPVKEKPPKEPKKQKEPKPPKSPKQRKMRELPRLSVRTDTENPQAIAEYMEKVSRMEEWNKRFDAALYRALAVVAALAVILIVLWNVEIAHVSVEGRGAYEIGVNVFGMTSSVREIDTAALIREEKVKSGSVGFVVFRIIDDMYITTGALDAYGEGEPVLIGLYGPGLYTGIFEKSDFSLGRANMQVRRAVRGDKKYTKQLGITLGRSVLIREYTEKYGGEHESNLESLKNAGIMRIIDRETVTDEAKKAIEDIFSKDNFVTGRDVPMVITDKSTPAPSEVPAVTAAPKPKRPATGSNNKRTPVRRTSSSGSSKRRNDDDDDDDGNNASSSTAPSATSKPSESSKPSATSKPVVPIREAPRPTANPVTEE